MDGVVYRGKQEGSGSTHRLYGIREVGKEESRDSGERESVEGYRLEQLSGH